MKRRVSKQTFITLSGILCALALVAGVWFFGGQGPETSSWVTDVKNWATKEDVPEVTVPPDWVTYQSDRYDFSFSHPKELAFQEVDQGGDSMTIVFQDPSSARMGFQVYITPHALQTITGETILRDVPHGAIEDLKEEQLRPDLLVATFWSNNPFTGRAREIWFLHSSYLFEFTSYDSAEDLLRNVLASLQLN
jgi:hypothetical protein